MINTQKKRKSIIPILIISLIMCFITSCQSSVDNPETITLEEAKIIINKFNLANVNSIELLESENYFGDEILTYICNDNIMCLILASNRSLVQFGTKEVDTKTSIELSDDEFQQIAIYYVEKIWDFNNIQIQKNEMQQLGEHSVFIVEGVMGEGKRYFGISLNGKGKLVSITSYPNDIDLKKGVSKDSAREKSMKIIKERIPFCDLDKLTLVDESLTKEYKFPAYHFKYEYRQDNPTINNFDFDCGISINAATGEFCLIDITPIVDNIDIIKIDEAEKLAKKYIADVTGKDFSNFKIKRSSLDAYEGELEYHFAFYYTEDSNMYSIIMQLSNNKFSTIDIESIE